LIFVAISATIDVGILLKGGGLLAHKLKASKGQGIIEYALILILVAMVVLTVLTFLGPAIGNAFSEVISML